MTRRAPSPFLWLDMWMEGCTTGLRLFETMAAVPAVVNARMPIIGAAVCNPLTGDWPELYAMVAEKTDAFVQASVSLTRDMQAIQSGMFRLGRYPESGAARIRHHAIGATGRALAPIHAAATRNARRLRARS